MDMPQADQIANRKAIEAQFGADIGVNPQVAKAEARYKKAGEGIDTDEKNALNNAIRDFGFAMMADPGGQKSRGIGGALRGTLAAAARSAPAGLASWKATKADVQKRRADLGALEDQLAAAQRAEHMAIVQFGHTSQQAEMARQVTRETADKVERAHNRHTDMLATSHHEASDAQKTHWAAMLKGQVDQTRKYDLIEQRDTLKDASNGLVAAQAAVKQAEASGNDQDRKAAVLQYTQAKKYMDEVRSRYNLPVVTEAQPAGMSPDRKKDFKVLQ